MKKKYGFHAIDHKKCIVCRKNLKANLVHKNPNADMCYRHHMMRLWRRSPDGQYRYWLKNKTS